MNAGLQCLSHTTELTKYFLLDLHKEEINKDNPIGSGGRVAMAYGALVRDLWNGSSSRIAPWELKRAVGQVAS